VWVFLLKHRVYVKLRVWVKLYVHPSGGAKSIFI